MEYPGGKQLYACKQRMKAKRDSCGDFTRWHIFCVQSHDLNHWSALFWLPNFDGNNLKRDMECWIYTQLNPIRFRLANESVNSTIKVQLIRIPSYRCAVKMGFGTCVWAMCFKLIQNTFWNFRCSTKRGYWSKYWYEITKFSKCV